MRFKPFRGDAAAVFRKVFMGKKKGIILYVVILLLLLAGSILTGTPGGKAETIKEVMRDGVLHEENKCSLFGLMEVNPAVISAFTVTAILLIVALLIRIFVIPRFKTVPRGIQTVVEAIIGFFDDLAKQNSPHRHGFLSFYIFTAGVYIFFSTLFELFGLQTVTTAGHSISLSAPIADINGAIAMGVTSYGVILFGGLIHNKFKGALGALKDFSLPISMSFRLFGALLSGLLVTELVYYSISLSFVLPVAVAVMFTLLHAIIQTYVLTMLTAHFYGEVTEPSEKKEKKDNRNSEEITVPSEA